MAGGAGFQPSEEHYLQVLDLLRRASDPRPDVVAAVWQHFGEYSQRADFCCYLAHILSVPDPRHDDSVREWAAVVLKNGARSSYESAILPSLSFIQQAVLGCVADPHRGVRNAAAHCVAALVAGGGVRSWPGVLDHLVAAAASAGGDAGALGAAQALRDVCEDCACDFVAESSPAPALAPRLLGLLSHPAARVREHALWSAVEIFTACREELVEEPRAERWARRLLPELFAGAMRLAHDAEPAVRKGVCRVLLFAGDVAWPLVHPHLPDVVAYLLETQARREDEALALEACDFWQCAIENAAAEPAFAARVPELLRLLCDGLAYTDEQLAMLGVEGDAEARDAGVIHQRGKRRRDADADGDDAASDGADAASGDGDDDDSDSDSDGAEYNVRICCGRTLEMMSLLLPPDELLRLLLPDLLRRLQPEQPWLTREAALLALGAVADGCRGVIAAHMPALVKGLAVEPQGPLPPPVGDAHPLVRAMACWTLSKYIGWLTGDGRELLPPVLQALTARVGDPSRRVQHRGCTALEKFVEALGDGAAPFAHPILGAAGAALATCPAANLVAVYDLIITVAEAVGGALAAPELTAALMPPLTARWRAAADDSAELPGLMGCLTAVAAALGPAFQPYVAEGFDRACRVLSAQCADDDGGDADLIVAALDLFSGLADGVGAGLDALVAARPDLPAALLHCAADRRSRVRQSALAACGDVAQWCWPRIAPHAPSLLALCVASFDPATPGGAPVTVNALWAVGNACVQLGPALRGLAGGEGAVPAQLADEIAPLLTAATRRTVRENAAIALGRVALAAPEAVAHRLPTVLRDWCALLRGLRDDEEKEQAFRGVVGAARLNPAGVLPHLAHVCDAACSWDAATMPAALRAELRLILDGCRRHLGDAWGGYFAQFPHSLQAKMAELYGIN